MTWLRSFFGNIFWASLFCLFIATAAVAQMSRGQPPSVVIDQTTAFSWPIMVLAVISAAGYVTMVVTNSNHRNDKSIHLTAQQVEQKHPTREVCDEKHNEITRRFDEGVERFDRLEAKLDKLLEK